MAALEFLLIYTVSLKNYMIDFDYISHRHTDFSDLLRLPLETLSGWITWNLGEHIHGPQKRDSNSTYVQYGLDVQYI